MTAKATRPDIPKLSIQRVTIVQGNRKIHSG
jgi:hypothetical protein